MKIDVRIKRYVFVTSLVVVTLLSMYIAIQTYRYYGVVARGIVGIVVLYLSYFFGRYSGMDVSNETLLTDLRKGKYLIAAIAASLISSWATLQIFEMILFFWKR